MGDYKSLDVWKKSILLVKAVYSLVSQLPDIEKFSLALQMRRAVTSIALNLAEGHCRSSVKELRYFLNIARGSAGEVEAQITICTELGYFSSEEAEPVLQLCDAVKGMLFRYIKRLEQQR